MAFQGTFSRNRLSRRINFFEHSSFRGTESFEESTLYRSKNFKETQKMFSAKIYFWAQSYCHGLQPGDSYLATIYDGGINSWLNAKMQEWIQDGDHVSHK